MSTYGIKENMKAVEEQIDAACKKAGRDRSQVTLIAVKIKFRSLGINMSFFLKTSAGI